MTAGQGSGLKAAMLAPCLLFGALPALAAERLVVPFEISDLQHMIVAIQINGQEPTTGVVDTAATFAMVDSRTAAQSGVAAPGSDAPIVNVLGVNGSRDYPVVQLGSLKAGNIHLYALDAAYSHDLDIPGTAANVLPSSAFPGDVLEFDFRSGLISAYDGRPDRPKTTNFDSVKYAVEGGLIFIDIHINGKKGRALIDTGSNLTYVNSTFADLAALRPNLEKTKLLQGATGGDNAVRIATARRVRLADFYFDQSELYVSDPAMFTELGIEDEPVMVIGLDLLSGFGVQFDRRRSRLVLSLPELASRGIGLNLRARDSRIQ